MGGVGFEDVAVAGFEGGGRTLDLLTTPGPMLYARGGEENLSLPYFYTVHRIWKVFAKKCVSLCFGCRATTAVGFARLNLVSISNVRPMLQA